MLSQFVMENRAEIIERCRALVAARSAPRPTDLELRKGIPLFLDQLTATLRSTLEAKEETDAVSAAAMAHGSDLLRMGFTIGQVVHDYGDVCQTITELAIERATTITTVEFKALNLCLDQAIAGAVTEYERGREANVDAGGPGAATVDHGFFAHELRNLLGTASLAFDALRRGAVGISGSTGAILERSLVGMRHLIDRSVADVRLQAGLTRPERIVVGDLVDEVEVSARMDASTRNHHFSIELNDNGAVVEADRQILASIVANLVQNAFKYTPPHSCVVLRTSSTADWVQIEVEDECGGLPPGLPATLFKPFEQRGADRTGLGLGLAICQRGVAASGGTIEVRDLPGKGCVFTVRLPCAVADPGDRARSTAAGVG